MIRETYVMRGGRLVPKRLAVPRTTAARIHVISDTMAPVKHMGTGRVHDSKSAFRADTRATGCVEVGTDRAILREQRHEPSQRDIVMDVKKSLEQLRSR
jgi:hypothetical protein